MNLSFLRRLSFIRTEASSPRGSEKLEGPMMGGLVDRSSPLVHDPTPTTKSGIEGLSNFHRGQYDLLVTRIYWMQDTLDRDRVVLRRLKANPSQQFAARKMEGQMNAIRKARRALEQVVQYHLEEFWTLNRALVEMNMAEDGHVRLRQAQREAFLQRGMGHTYPTMEKPSEGSGGSRTVPSSGLNLKWRRMLHT